MPQSCQDREHKPVFKGDLWKTLKVGLHGFGYIFPGKYILGQTFELFSLNEFFGGRAQEDCKESGIALVLGSLTKSGLGEAQVLLRRNSGDLITAVFSFFKLCPDLYSDIASEITNS